MVCAVIHVHVVYLCGYQVVPNLSCETWDKVVDPASYVYCTFFSW